VERIHAKRFTAEELFNILLAANEVIGNDEPLNQRKSESSGPGPYGGENSGLSSKWQPTCKDLAGNMSEHQSDGNCMFYALYEAYGEKENLGISVGNELENTELQVNKAVSVRNLRRLVIEKQVEELRQKCTDVAIDIETAITKKQQAITDIIDEIGESGVKIESGSSLEGKTLKKCFTKMSSDKIDIAV
jgi:hypothetical protein